MNLAEGVLNSLKGILVSIGMAWLLGPPPAITAIHAYPTQVTKLSSKQIYEKFDNSVVKVVTDNGSGTGFFVKNGYLVATCYHVIDGAHNISIEGTGGAKWSVGAVYLDKKSDAALLKLTEDSKRKAIPVGDASKLQPGDELSVIGNPLGFLTESLTTGIVSAKRSDKSVELIQTTAAVSQGSSGSPVISSGGKVVGFVSFVFTQGESLNMAVTSAALVKLWGEDSVPIQVFFSLSPKPTQTNKPTRPTDSVTPSPEDAEKGLVASRKVAEWWGSIVKEQIKWEVWWSNECKAPSARATEVIDVAYEHAKSFEGAVDDYESTADALTGLWTTDDIQRFFDTLKDIREAAGELAGSQAKADRAARYESSRALAARNEAKDAAYTRLEGLKFRLGSMFKDRPWFSWKIFRGNLSPSVLFFSFRPSLEGVLPDPVLDEGCYIAFADESTGLKAGAQIKKLSSLGEVAQEVGTWRDVIDWIKKHPAIQSLYVTYVYQGNTGSAELTIRR